MEENEKKIFDEDWQKLREEYQQIFEDKEERQSNNDLTVGMEDLPEIEFDFQDSIDNKIETIKNEDVDENQEDIDIRKELESLKTDKDKIQNTYESFELETEKKNNVKEMFNIASSTMEQLLKRMEKRTHKNIFSEENRREIANVIVIIGFIVLLISFCLFASQIPQLIINVFNLGEKHDTIVEENIVYVDENNHIYHYQDCSHIKDGVRYIKLEEIYAVQLGYKECHK